MMNGRLSYGSRTFPKQAFCDHRRGAKCTLTSFLALLLLLTWCGNARSEKVVLVGTRLQFLRDNGGPLVVGEPSAVRLAESNTSIPSECVELSPLQPGNGSLHSTATFVSGIKATLDIRSGPHWQRIAVRPEKPGNYDISLVLTGGLNPAYGMGDHGGYGAAFNLYPFRRDPLYQHQGGQELRFVSTFTVFPKHQMAMVLFSPDRKCAVIDEKSTSLGVRKSPDLGALYVFEGSMEEIYAAYREARHAEGFVDGRPDAEFFRPGFESYGALSWETSQATIQDAVQQLLERGFPIRWVVCGSGFWLNPRGKPKGPEGATTSFGLWGQRYPDPDGFKRFMKERHLKLILGLRHGFPALTADGGQYDEAVHGPFPREALDKGYVLTDSTGKPRIFNVQFPRFPVYLLDPHNAKALDWFADGAERWGADGFKEDFMFAAEKNQYYDDYKHNPIDEKLSERGALMMVRNAAYSVPGSILRINDTDIQQNARDQDRIPINCLAFAASGQPNVYPDIIGGRPIGKWTDRERRYMVRTAMQAAVLPAMSLGNLPWKMNDPASEAAMLKAVTWHDRYLPYIYSAAMESFRTGYPHTVTPLPIAFPDDAHTYDLASRERKMYSWMLGPSLLACPLFGSDFDKAESRDVYLPQGSWMDYETGEVFKGPRLLKNVAMPIDKLPLFVGATGILVREQGTTLRVELFPQVMNGSSLRITDPATGKSSLITVPGGVPTAHASRVVVRTLPEKTAVQIERRRPAGWEFTLAPGIDYQVEGAE